jgi:tyrosine-protein kinase Etk/Wzc
MLKYELNLRDYIRIVRKRKVLIACSFLVAFALAAFVDRSRTPMYEASTTVQVSERRSVANMLTDIIMYAPGDIMETQSRIITGTPVLTKTAVAMGYVAANADRSDVLAAGARVRGMIRTERVGNTNIIRIVARSSKPEDAMRVANNVAEAYVQESLMQRNLQSRQAREFIEKQLSQIETRLYDAEDRLRRFGTDVTHVAASDSVQKKLMDLEYELSDVLQKFTEKHPKVIAMRQKIKQVEEQVAGFSGKELSYARLKREVEVHKNIFSMLSQKLEEVKIAEAGKASGAEIVDPAVLPKRPVSSGGKTNVLLGGILGAVVGFILSFVVETLDTSMATIEDVENTMNLPVLGVVPSVGPESGEVETVVDKIRRHLLPHFAKKRRRGYVSLMVHMQPTSPNAEAFRNIKTNLKLSDERKVILVTSAGPQEGKTTTLLNIALACAQDGLKTLVIDSDLRRPTVAESFGMKKRPGLGDYLMGTVSRDDAIRGMADMMMGSLGVEKTLCTPGLDRLWVFPSGTLPLNPAEILKSKEFDALLAWMRSEFDVVLFDSPPVLPVTDAAVLSPKMDAVVLCYEIGRTSRHALMRAKSQLESVDAQLRGVILNHIQPETDAVEVYPYYYRYRYYAKKGESEDRERSMKDSSEKVS